VCLFYLCGAFSVCVFVLFLSVCYLCFVWYFCVSVGLVRCGACVWCMCVFVWCICGVCVVWVF